MINNKELTRKFVIQKVLLYINSEEWKRELRNNNKYAGKYFGTLTLSKLHTDDMSNESLYEMLRIAVGILRFNSLDSVIYEELWIDLYSYYMSQCMSYSWSPWFVLKIMGKIINMTLWQILLDKSEYYHEDKLNTEIIRKMLVWELELDKFIWSITWAIKKKEDEWTINNLGDDDDHWLRLEWRIRRRDWYIINKVQDLTKSSNEDLKFIYNELIKDSWKKYKVQKTLINNMTKEEAKNFITPIFRRHLYILCIKSIVFYKTHQNGDMTVNYDFYWKHKDKIDRLKAMSNDEERVNTEDINTEETNTNEKENKDIVVAKKETDTLEWNKMENGQVTATTSEDKLKDINEDPWF